MEVVLMAFTRLLRPALRLYIRGAIRTRPEPAVVLVMARGMSLLLMVLRVYSRKAIRMQPKSAVVLVVARSLWLLGPAPQVYLRRSQRKSLAKILL